MAFDMASRSRGEKPPESIRCAEPSPVARLEEAAAHARSVLLEHAVGLVHDVRNLLGLVVIKVRLAREALARGDTELAERALLDVEKTLRRTLDVADRCRTLRVRGAEERPVIVADAIEEALSFAEARLCSRPVSAPRIELLVTVQVTQTLAVPLAEFVTAVVNLLFNAIDALDGGGLVELTVSEETGYVVVSVADDGPGMTADVARRAFDPFFTTKGAAGTGVGLSIVRRFAHRFGGDVALRTASGGGTTFTLRLPTRGPRLASTRATRPPFRAVESSRQRPSAC